MSKCLSFVYINTKLLSFVLFKCQTKQQKADIKILSIIFEIPNNTNKLSNGITKETHQQNQMICVIHLF